MDNGQMTIDNEDYVFSGLLQNTRVLRAKHGSLSCKTREFYMQRMKAMQGRLSAVPASLLSAPFRVIRV
jgi:hypothetical protein